MPSQTVQVLPVAQADIAILKGATFSVTLYYETGDPPVGVNLSSGYRARLQIRKTATSKAVIAELSTTNGGIASPMGTDGAITLFISAANTEAIAACGGRAVYDLLLIRTSDNFKTRLMEGKVIISEGVTEDV